MAPILGVPAVAWLPRFTLETGLLPMDAALQGRLDAVERACPEPPLQQLPAVVYTDGSAVDPTDPLLRRAAWAVTWPMGGVWQRVSAACPGRQTVGRAELRAAVYAAEATGGNALVVSDSRYVVDGAAELRVGGGQHLLDGQDGDLWRRLRACPPMTRWVPSHRTLAQAREQGLSLADWCGNKEADSAAAAAAQICRDEASGARKRTLAALWACQAIMGRINAAAMEHGVRHRPRQPPKRKPRPVLHHRPKRKAPVRPAVPQGDHDVEGIHRLTPQRGPVGAAEVTGRLASWRLACTRCGATAAKVRNWSSLLATPCDGNTTFRWECHDLAKRPGGWGCARCGLLADPAHRASAARARCPVPAVQQHGEALEAGSHAYAAQRAALARWKGWLAGRPATQPNPHEAAPRRLAAAMLEHLPRQVPGRQHAVCLRCGSRARTVRGLRGLACQAGAWPQFSRALLRAGALDPVLYAEPPDKQQWARREGWAPLSALVAAPTDAPHWGPARRARSRHTTPQPAGDMVRPLPGGPPPPPAPHPVARPARDARKRTGDGAAPAACRPRLPPSRGTKRLGPGTGPAPHCQPSQPTLRKRKAEDTVGAPLAPARLRLFDSEVANSERGPRPSQQPDRKRKAEDWAGEALPPCRQRFFPFEGSGASSGCRCPRCLSGGLPAPGPPMAPPAMADLSRLARRGAPERGTGRLEQ